MSTRFASLDLTTNVLWGAIKASNLFFDPQKDPVFLKGKDTGWGIIYRDDGPENFISIRSKSFKLVKNAELNDIITSYSKLKFKLNLYLSGNLGNRKFSLVYDVDEKGIWESGNSTIEQLGLKPKLVVLNAYDGGASLKFQFGFFRLICSNLLVIPVKEKNFSITIRHKQGNFNPDLKTQVNSFLDIAAIKTNFEIRKNKIEEAMQNEFVQLPFNFFVNLPGDLVYLFLALIATHSKCKVEVKDKDKIFPDIQDLETAKELLGLALKARKEKYKLKGDADANWDLFDQFKALSYSEKVNTCWDIYNLLIKTTQIFIKEFNRRMRLTAYLARYLL